ncbi:MAG: ribonuclease HII [Panacagrimonas sp.]
MNLLPDHADSARIAGIDEAGRGCLAGPVYAAAVILRDADPIAGLDDSKKLSPARREKLFEQIVQRALAWGIARAETDEIERLNIEKASHLAMLRAVQTLVVPPTECWVDGNRAPDFGVPVRKIVGGDGIEPCIMAASILAKVARDREMRRLDGQHPGYGFAQHKGYGTPEHLAALKGRGPCAIHRMSFAPCSPDFFAPLASR